MIWIVYPAGKPELAKEFSTHGAALAFRHAHMMNTGERLLVRFRCPGDAIEGVI